MEKQENTIVFGCGRLGSSLANLFYDEGRDVTVIDRDKSSFRKLSLTYGGEMIEANGTDMEVLKSLPLHEKTTAIVVTNQDNVNIMIAQLLKEEFHVKNVVSRLYDPERSCVYEKFGIDVICPTELATQRIRAFLEAHHG